MRDVTNPPAAAIVLACAIGLLGAGPDAAPGSQPAVRFHHLHFASSDPATAMRETAGALGGVRVVLQGLGVGVRAGDEFVLFDRAGTESAGAPRAGSAAEVFAAAARWLESRGVRVVPESFAQTAVARLNVPDSLDHVAFAASAPEATVDALRRAGATPVRRSGDSAFYRAGPALVEVTRDTESPDRFWCPMHPDVRSPGPGACPLCAMALVAMPPPRLGNYRMEVTQTASASGGLAGLRVVIREPDTGEAVRAFTEVHERLLHLFIVSRDFKMFAHEHPVPAGDGFEIQKDLPPGTYMLIADFVPTAGPPQLIQQAIVTRGATASPFPAAPALAADMSDQIVEGVRFHLEPRRLAPGREADLRVVLTEAASGRPVSDLEPYLGAPGHLLIVNADATEAIHGHPETAAAPSAEVVFTPLLPAAGLYKLWVQVQRRGRVLTAAFVIDVPDGR